MYCTYMLRLYTLVQCLHIESVPVHVHFESLLLSEHVLEGNVHKSSGVYLVRSLWFWIFTFTVYVISKITM